MYCRGALGGDVAVVVTTVLFGIRCEGPYSIVYGGLRR